MSNDHASADALSDFLHRGLIREILGELKSGKEATTWLCRADSKLGGGLVVAKLYKELSRRSFRNDSSYQQGRVITNKRVKRAFENKTAFGREVQLHLWIAEEVETLEILHDEGLDVPRVLAHAGRAILMEYIGDEEKAAMPLAQADLLPEQARWHLKRVLWNIEEMLACCCVHGDLSGYNMLWWWEKVWLIDFPQAVDPRFNPQALNMLQRDVDNVAKLFASFGADFDSGSFVRRLWHRFVNAELGGG